MNAILFYSVGIIKILCELFHHFHTSENILKFLKTFVLKKTVHYSKKNTGQWNNISFYQTFFPSNEKVKKI